MIGYDSNGQQYREGSMVASKHGSVTNSMAVLPYTATGKIPSTKNQKAI